MNDAETEFSTLERPLEGLRVIEACDQVAGAYTGRLLRLLGAEVLKLEDPTSVSLRKEPPLLDNEGAYGALFAYLNAGKRSISMTTAGTVPHRIRGELAAVSDVFIDDRPLSERRRELEDDDYFLSQNDRLIYLSVLPFGASGPYNDYVGEEINTFHGSGEGNLLPNGLGYEMFPDRGPIKAYGHLSEYQAGVGAAVAVMAALFTRDLIGGQAIDISVQDVSVALGGHNLQRFGDGVLETRQTRSFTYGGVMECSDGFVELLVLEQHQWEELVVMLGSPEWACVPELHDPVERARHGAEINRQIRMWTRELTVDTVVSLARAHQVPLDRYNAPSDVLSSEHEQARMFFDSFPLPDGREVTMPNLPFKLLPEREWPDVGPPPRNIGEANELVYGEYLNHSRSEVDGWIASGVI